MLINKIKSIVCIFYTLDITLKYFYTNDREVNVMKTFLQPLLQIAEMEETVAKLQDALLHAESGYARRLIQEDLKRIKSTLGELYAKMSSMDSQSSEKGELGE